MRQLFRILFVIICIFPLLVNAQEKTEEKKAQVESWQHFSILVSTISTMRENLESLRTELSIIKEDRERDRINQEINQLSLDLQSLNTALEMLATGGADLSLFGVKVDEPFNLRDELQSIFEPILTELKRLSERPRKIERLRSDLLYYQQRLDVAEEALASLTNYRESAPTVQLTTAFKNLENRWLKRKNDLQNRVNLVQFELDQMLDPDGKNQKNTWEALNKLFGERLLNLGIAALVMILTYSILSVFAKLYKRLVLRDAITRKTFVARIGSLFFYLLTTLIVLLSGMTVFYVQGDWVLLGLFLIILAGAAWAIQKSLPRFLIEARLILNLGPVREGERLIYNDLPWEVTALNFQAILTNPLLSGGTLRIPIKDLVSYNSRKFEQDEPWFPCKAGDWVLLDGEIYGKVFRQTPEQVMLQVLNGIKTFGTTDFLAMNPYNLSTQGFSVLETVGVDYQYQSAILDEVKQKLEKDVVNYLNATDLSEHINSVNIQFQKTDSSSLNFMIEVFCLGSGAHSYLRLPREINAAFVSSCNKNSWVIPFAQMVVHKA